MRQVYGLLMGVVLLAVVLAWTWPGAAVQQPGRVAVEPEELRPGLVGAYQSLRDGDARGTRIDRKPAFYLGHSSPDARLPPGPFEVVWTGLLHVKDRGPITFDAFVGGEASVEVDGVAVLQGRGETATTHVQGKQALDRKLGHYRVMVRFRALPDVPARLQLWWQAPTFAHEPIPPWHFKHLGRDLPPTARADELAAEGQKLARRLGCARCHASAFPGVAEPPPGPSLADTADRLGRDWVLRWLADPAQVHADARMPALFAPDRTGFAERWLIAEHLAGARGARPAADPAGDHRAGRLAYLNLGCAACHPIPDLPRAQQADLDRTPLRGLGDRMSAEQLTAFLGNPHGRYPDGRMPRIPVPPQTGRDLSAYLLLWSKPSADVPAVKPPTPGEISAVVRRLRVRNQAAAGPALLSAKRCAECHPGLGATTPADIPLKRRDEGSGCLSGKTLPRFTLAPRERAALAAYLKVAPRERHPSPFAARQRLLERAGCVRCHQRDSDRPPPLEVASSTLGGAFLQHLPAQRTPRLTYPHQKFLRSYLLTTVREGVAGLRTPRYSYRMPAFGHEAETLVQALAEGDGELPAGSGDAASPVKDPTLGPTTGPLLVGFQGYACVSCHVWEGKLLAPTDPGNIATDLTKVAGRIRRDWFERFLEDPARFHPGTPMPSIFQRGQPALLPSVLDGDPGKQKDALWSYFALGSKAPSPKPPPPLVVTLPDDGGPLVAQVPMRVPPEKSVESLTLLYDTHDLIVYDLGAGAPHTIFTGGRILRDLQGRLRTYTALGTVATGPFTDAAPWRLVGAGKPEDATARTLHGYDRLRDGARLRWKVQFSAGAVEVVEALRLVRDGDRRRLLRELAVTGIPGGRAIEVTGPAAGLAGVAVQATTGKAFGKRDGKAFRATLTPDGKGAAAVVTCELPPARRPPPPERMVLTAAVQHEGALERPGYRAVAYPRPKTATGEDRVMPSAVAVHPRDGRVFVASMKTGELFVLRDPDAGAKAHFENYTGGLFEEAYSLLAEADGLYVLHRRNLTRVVDTNGDGRADRFDRVAALPHGVGETYDYAYGLARDRTGAFVLSYAPYANRHLPGSGGALRLVPGKPPREIAFGMRNPVGWCAGPDGAIFFTDNQGEWVATNKLSHVAEGRFYGFPNPGQPQHAKKPAGKAAVWVPYAWARSINGVAHDHTGGKFGPFAGQVFLAELMYGGAIVRANLEKVNGEYQGACFPFWGKGLLGPLTLAFAPTGRLYVGSVTEPGWMAQPDRGALYGIDFTGEVPFEIQSIHVRPQGFRLVFTRPVAPETARRAASYHLEHHRYEYTGAYGSPELDRTAVPVRRVELAADGRSVELTTAPLVRERVYLISAPGMRSPAGEALVHPTGAYTLNEIPAPGK